MTAPLPPLPDYLPDGIVSHETIKDFAKLAVREALGRAIGECSKTTDSGLGYRSLWATEIADAIRAMLKEYE